MHFDFDLQSLEQKLRDRLVAPLPGALAHETMRAVPVGSAIPEFNHALPPRKGSVLIMLYDDEGTIRFPLIKRPDYTGAHSGQISLPGGKAEANEDYVMTALREGEEEIGVDRSSVNVIGRLSDFLVIPSNFVVTPVVGTLSHKPAYRPDAREVVRIIEGNLKGLLDDHAVQRKEILAAGRFRMMAPHFDIEGEVVWGATAMILSEFRAVLKDIFELPSYE